MIHITLHTLTETDTTVSERCTHVIVPLIVKVVESIIVMYRINGGWCLYYDMVDE
jgi:hypothetical protein